MRDECEHCGRHIPFSRAYCACLDPDRALTDDEIRALDARHAAVERRYPPSVTR